jgi:hypothetical protein
MTGSYLVFSSAVGQKLLAKPAKYEAIELIQTRNLLKKLLPCFGLVMWQLHLSPTQTSQICTETRENEKIKIVSKILGSFCVKRDVK